MTGSISSVGKLNWRESCSLRFPLLKREIVFLVNDDETRIPEVLLGQIEHLRFVHMHMRGKTAPRLRFGLGKNARDK